MRYNIKLFKMTAIFTLSNWFFWIWMGLYTSTLWSFISNFTFCNCCGRNIFSTQTKTPTADWRHCENDFFGFLCHGRVKQIQVGVTVQISRIKNHRKYPPKRLICLAFNTSGNCVYLQKPLKRKCILIKKKHVFFSNITLFLIMSLILRKVQAFNQNLLHVTHVNFEFYWDENCATL